VKIKTSELTGTALDRAVATIENIGCFPPRMHSGKVVPTDNSADCYSPSTDWAQGGPIIEREHITVVFRNSVWVSAAWSARISQDDKTEYGPTPLIAAMRCLVAAKLGDEIDVPGELT